MATAQQIQMQVAVPAGVGPGTTIQVQAPSGQMLQIVVPPNVTGPATITIQAPMGPGQAIGAVATEDDYEAYEPLQDLRFDVTDPWESACMFLWCPCIGYQTKTLILTDQEVTFRIKNLCGTSKQKRPYAHLGSVDKHSAACGCHAIVSDFTPLNEKGEGGLRPGMCGCDQALVEKIVGELQMRKEKRGGIAQIRKLDYVLDKAAKLGTQAPLLVHKLGINFQPRPAPDVQRQTLPTKVIDVSSNVEMICCTTKTLTLGAEEATLSINACGGCSTINSKREYGELGFVEKRKSCVCCFKVASDISPLPGRGDMAPGCPCTNRTKVNAIVRELRERMAVRGQVGQIKKQEKIMKLIAEVEGSMELITSHLKIQVPPPQEGMKRYVPEPPLESKTYDVTSDIDSCMSCCCTCGMAGCTKETVELKEDDMYITSKNRIDDSDMKIPYAEMDSVDVLKTCCCCFSVNEQSPGVGCKKDQVEDLAAELQKRKETRGNIAHLKQLRSMQSVAKGLDGIADLVLKKQGIQYPPSPEVMAAAYRDGPPRALKHPTGPPHIEPEADFENKVYDVTSYPEGVCRLCCTCCLGGWRTSTIELGPDEMLLETKDLCMRSQSRTPYGNLGAVETETACCCCSELPDVARPGCGCSNEYVEEIAQELQERKVKRGMIAQMFQQENIIIEVLNLEAKLGLLVHHHGIQYPPPPEVMAKVFTPAADQPSTIGAAMGHLGGE